jgi:hypothetical protein
MDLTHGQRTALQNLLRKKDGQSVDWITIADARALTDLGLAERTRSGWQITKLGETVAADTPVKSTSELVFLFGPP